VRAVAALGAMMSVRRAHMREVAVLSALAWIVVAVIFYISW
jgi:hypothetical protein